MANHNSPVHYSTVSHMRKSSPLGGHGHTGRISGSPLDGAGRCRLLHLSKGLCIDLYLCNSQHYEASRNPFSHSNHSKVCKGNRLSGQPVRGHTGKTSGSHWDQQSKCQRKQVSNHGDLSYVLGSQLPEVLKGHPFHYHHLLLLLFLHLSP